MLKGEGEKTEITSGTAVAKATKLTIEAEANPDYELTVIQIGEEKYMTSPVEIEVDKSLAIMQSSSRFLHLREQMWLLREFP